MSCLRLSIACAVLLACTTNTTTPTPTGDPGPRSGLGEDLAVHDLSTADRDTLCAWWSDTLGGAGRTEHCADCRDGACTDWDVTVNTIAQCAQYLATVPCDATVQDAEDCALAQATDLCAAPAECRVFDAC